MWLARGFTQPPQGILTGCAQWREVDLNDVPEPIFPAGVILVTQAVAERRISCQG
jgi:hypothetical protein